jgi:hypothetical protein
MTRICSKATREKLAKTKLPPKSPRWLRSAVWNARSEYPMSAEGETRMCEALGIASPKRQPRRFYRPCLSVELGEALQGTGIDIEATLWKELNRRHAASCR